jgi:DNA-binding NarL/FixJ family response regulator
MTRRQLRILQLLATGCSHRHIADVLMLSIKTIGNEVIKIGSQLDMAGQTTILHFATEHQQEVAAILAVDEL